MKQVKQVWLCAAIAGIIAVTMVFGQSPGPGRGILAPAPPAGSPALYKTAEELMTALKAAVEKSPATATSTITVTDEYSINILRRGSGASALTHPGWTELHYILDGSATFVTGGTLVPAGSPAAGGGGTQQAQTIQGGVSHHVSKGDAVLVPAGTPHWYKDVDGAVTYLEVRFIAPHKDDAGK